MVLVSLLGPVYLVLLDFVTPPESVISTHIHTGDSHHTQSANHFVLNHVSEVFTPAGPSHMPYTEFSAAILEGNYRLLFCLLTNNASLFIMLFRYLALHIETLILFPVITVIQTLRHRRSDFILFD